jgi:hypothetical protein
MPVLDKPGPEWYFEGDDISHDKVISYIIESVTALRMMDEEGLDYGGQRFRDAEEVYDVTREFLRRSLLKLKKRLSSQDQLTLSGANHFIDEMLKEIG